MQLKLTIKPGGWGDGCLADMRTVAESVICALTRGLPSDCRFDVLLEQHEQPRALARPSDRGEYVIRLSAQAAKWFQLTFQLGHEFTHVIADAWSWDEHDPFGWFEEVLADAGSLFALRSLADSWAHQPPRPGWQVNCFNFSKYLAEYLAESGRYLDKGVDFKQWFAKELASFKVEDAQRPRFTIIARHLLPVFENDPTSWRALRCLHSFPRPEGMSFAGFLHSWRVECADESRGVVDDIAAILGVSLVTTGTASAKHARARAEAQKLLTAIRLAVSSDRRPSSYEGGTPAIPNSPEAPETPSPEPTRSSN